MFSVPLASSPRTRRLLSSDTPLSGLVQRSTIPNRNGRQRSITGIGPRSLNLTDDVHPFHHAAKDDVFPVQMRGGDCGEKELAAVCVGAGVCHAVFGRVLLVID